MNDKKICNKSKISKKIFVFIKHTLLVNIKDSNFFVQYYN